MPHNKFASIASFICEISKKIPQQDMVVSYKTVDEVIDEDSNFIEKKICMNFKLTRVEKRRIREVELTIVSQ